ncbi:hypothetical protein ABD440_11610 [Chromobacterium piscinae]|uniref:hypothetical protein n=1 Tax=Chromobacterium piscinae TaxID=686831 RepID=UPI0031FC7914
MKLATYHNHTRDGQLMVVSRDLTRAVAVPAIAATLQGALDNWAQAEPRLKEVYAALNQGRVPDEVAFDAKRCLSPLPRAYQWADGSAYLNHVELVRKARGAEVPESFYTDPLMYQSSGLKIRVSVVRFRDWPPQQGQLAQLVEQRIENPRVRG